MASTRPSKPVRSCKAICALPFHIDRAAFFPQPILASRTKFMGQLLAIHARFKTSRCSWSIPRTHPVLRARPNGNFWSMPSTDVDASFTGLPMPSPQKIRRTHDADELRVEHPSAAFFERLRLHPDLIGCGGGKMGCDEERCENDESVFHGGQGQTEDMKHELACLCNHRLSFIKRPCPHSSKNQRASPPPATSPLFIDEYIGRVNSNHSGISIAHMRSPGGSAKPGQTPSSRNTLSSLKARSASSTKVARWKSP